MCRNTLRCRLVGVWIGAQIGCFCCLTLEPQIRCFVFQCSFHVIGRINNIQIYVAFCDINMNLFIQIYKYIFCIYLYIFIYLKAGCWLRRIIIDPKQKLLLKMATKKLLNDFKRLVKGHISPWDVSSANLFSVFLYFFLYL